MPPATVALFDVERLVLTEAVEPLLSPSDVAARDSVWNMAVQANPSLFDGPVVACSVLECTDQHVLRLSWVRVTYRHYALRRVPGATALPSLFVNVVQPTDDGRLLVARMAPLTAAPGRWQLPGGSVEPPPAGAGLEEADLAGQAARELAEELGLDVGAEALALWAVTRGENGSVGLTYLAPPQTESALRAALAAATAAERARNREPELDDVALVSAPTELAGLAGPHADYLEPVVRRFFDGL
ncbi:NUDIX hydrolase [Streptomyces vinaceus]